MGHTCPRCNQYCTCNGDIDDIYFGEDYNCTKDHDGCMCDEDEEWDGDIWDGDDVE